MTILEGKRTLSDEKVFWNEVKKASQRIGLSSEDALEWLLRLAQTDIPELSEGQWADLRAELEVFFHCGPPKSDHEMADLFFFTGHQGAPSWSPFLQRSGDVIRFQSTLRESLRALTEKGVATFPPIRVTPQIVRGTTRKKGVQSRLDLQPLSDKPFDRFIFHAVPLIEEYKNRIRSCRECGTLFLAYRGTQLFCTPRCQNRYTQRQFKDRARKTRFALAPGKMRPAKRKRMLPAKGSV